MGELTCHFKSGQCSESSRTHVRYGSSALAVFKLTATLTPNRRENKADAQSSGKQRWKLNYKNSVPASQAAVASRRPEQTASV
ncbi:hypothetical protein GCM10011328_23660 [Hafnia psychrotolerans]|jgi:hypothetical protein|uniref:Uncharacterized protein n=1 Tax=Hafnia psychrotolerans TaxID=1477018 RepID=A0ABQ1GQQ7_9GAMM|nr:hypothetical protein GCM10011328_23660 [Hafnia psychrotolerans]